MTRPARGPRANPGAPLGPDRSPRTHRDDGAPGAAPAAPSHDANRWTFFTNHAHVLFVLAQDEGARLRDVAERVQITERAAQRIVRELHEAGYLEVFRDGRRNRYRLNPELGLRHPVEAHCLVSDLLEVIARRPRNE